MPTVTEFGKHRVRTFLIGFGFGHTWNVQRGSKSPTNEHRVSGHPDSERVTATDWSAHYLRGQFRGLRKRCAASEERTAKWPESVAGTIIA